MDLVLEHQKQVKTYLDGMLSLLDLQDWLGQCSTLVDQAGDEEAKQVSARIWRLISEYSAGHRDEASVRGEMKQLLAATPIR